MNRTWKILIVVGVISLVAVIGWEFFQITTGGRTNFNLSVQEMGRGNLFSTGLDEHLESDPELLGQTPFSSPISFPSL